MKLVSDFPIGEVFPVTRSHVQFCLIGIVVGVSVCERCGRGGQFHFVVEGLTW